MTDNMTPERLEEIEARAQAADMGPWMAEDDNRITAPLGLYHVYLLRAKPTGLEDEQEAYVDSTENAAFIAYARADVPAMAAEISRCWAEVEKLGKMVDWLAQATSNTAPTSIRQGKSYWIKAAERAVSE